MDLIIVDPRRRSHANSVGRCPVRAVSGCRLRRYE